MELPSFLTRRIGSFPVWGWGLIAVAGVAVGVGFGRITRSRAAAAAPGDAAGDPVLTPRQAGMVGGAGLPGVAIVPSTPSQTSTGPTSNRQWATQASKALIARGASAFAAEQAVATYLAGDPITVEQRALINEAITLVGPPPEGSPRVKVITPPAAPQPTAPPATPTPLYVNLDVPIPPAPGSPVMAPPVTVPAPAPQRSYTVTGGDTLSAIAQRFYGTADWQKIYNANRDKLTNPDLIYPGQLLVIP